MECKKNICYILVGNKLDLNEQRCNVSAKLAERAAKRWGFEYIELSVSTAENIQFFKNFIWTLTEKFKFFKNNHEKS